MPVGERLVAPTVPVPLEDEGTSDASSGSHPSSSSSESSPGPRQRVRRLTRRMHYSEPEEVSGSTTGEAVDSPATTFPALCGPSNVTLAEEAHAVPAPRNRVEAGEPTATEASPVIVRTSRARNRLSRAHQEDTPKRASSQEARPKTPENRPPLPGQSRPSLHRSPNSAGDQSTQTHGRTTRTLHDEAPRGLSGEL